MRLCNAEVYISHSGHMHLIYTANLCKVYRVLLHQLFDMQLLLPPP